MKLNETTKDAIRKLIVDESNATACSTTLSNAFANIDAMPELPPECNDDRVMILGRIDIILQRLSNEPCFDDVFNVIEKAND